MPEKMDEQQKITGYLVMIIILLFMITHVSGEIIENPSLSINSMINQTQIVQVTDTSFAQYAAPPGISSVQPSESDVSLRKAEDAQLIQFEASKAVVLPKDRILSSPPKKLDYSPYLSFIRTQDGNGGCVGFTLMHLIDILKEMEHPYTPDKSFAYTHLRQEQLRDKEGIPDAIMTEELITKHGVASEVVYPSDYSVCSKNSNGFYVYDSMPPLTTTVKNEAAYYKIKSQEFHKPTDPDTVKTLLNLYGPVGGQGGSDIWKGHSMLIVGYDDLTQTFTVLNSWGDTWNYGGGTGNGFFKWPYSRISEIETIKSLVNEPSDRTGGEYAYTARISVNAPYSRNSLLISIGVVGETPLIFWNEPNKIGPWPDYNSDLTIDVYLPSYAKFHWPPGDDWYVTVSNNGSYNAVLDEVTFTKLNKNLPCKSVGKFSTDTYTPASGTLPVTISPKTEKTIYLSDTDEIPKPEFPDGEISVSSSGDLLSGTITGLNSVTNAGNIIQPGAGIVNYQVNPDIGLNMNIPGITDGISETGITQYAGDAINPVEYSISDPVRTISIRSVTIYHLLPILCVNMPDQWEAIGTAIIDGDNNFSFRIPPQYLSSVLAVAYSDSGHVVISSEPLFSSARNTLTKEPLTEKAIDFSVDPITERIKLQPLLVNPQ